MAEEKIIKNHIAGENTQATSEASAREGETAIENSDEVEDAAGTPQGHSLPTSDGRLWTRAVLFGSRKSQTDLDIIRAGELPDHDDDIYTATDIGQWALLYCVYEAQICSFVGMAWATASTSTRFGQLGLWWASFFYIHHFYRGLIILKRFLDQIYFIRDEVRITRHLARPEAQAGLLHRRDESVDTSTTPEDTSVYTASALSSRPESFIAQRSTAGEGQAEFGPPSRMDTEADIGFFPLARRKTFPRQNKQDS
jgi:hypothetical protein